MKLNFISLEFNCIYVISEFIFLKSVSFVGKCYFIKRKFSFSYRIPNFISRKMIYINRKPSCIIRKLDCISRKSICICRKLNCMSRKSILKKWKRIHAQEIKFQICEIKINSCEFRFHLWEIHQEMVWKLNSVLVIVLFT